MIAPVQPNPIIKASTEGSFLAIVLAPDPFDASLEAHRRQRVLLAVLRDEVRVVVARAGKAERVRAECKADAEKFCKGIAPGGGRILSCLKSRQPELQQACAAEFKRAGNRRPPAQ